MMWCKILIIIFALCCIRYYYNIRKLYKYASKVHGPMVLPIIGTTYYLIGSQPEKFIDRLIAILSKYPNLCRFWHYSKLVFVTSKPEHFEIILKSPKALSKDDFYNFFKPAIGDGLFTAPVPIWKKHRKLIAPAFRQNNLDGFVRIFSKHANQALENIKKKEEPICSIIFQSSFNISYETILGVNTETEEGTTEEFKESISRGLDIFCNKMFNPFYNYDFIFNLTEYSVDVKFILKNINKILYKIINLKTNELLNNERNMSTSLIKKLLEKSGKDKNVLNNKEVRDELFTFIVASFDTSASTNCFTLMLLGMHPEIQQKVFEEVLNVVGPTKPVEPKDLPNLKLLERVIKESLRIFPVAPFIARRLDDDVDLGDGIILPSSSSILLPFIYLHRLEEYWPNPLKFDPDRFLPENMKNRHTCCFLPFSYGLRNCIGLNYGMMAVKTFIATLIREFEFESEYKNVEDVELKISVMLKPTNGFKIKIKQKR